jgi:predicted outer membrane repeat protein
MKTLRSLIVTGLWLALIPAVPMAQTITSFTPSSASAGSTVTIAGTGFSSTMANNIVFFGAGRGTVTAANTTSLSVTVPPSTTYGPISVSVIGTGKTVISDKSFDLKFSAGDFDGSALVLNQTLSLGGTPWDTKMVDVNGDGKLDLLITRSFSSPLDIRTVAYLQNTSSGGAISFAPKVEVPTPQVSRANYFGTTDSRPTDPKKIIAADLDSDGKQDFVIVTNYDVCVVRDVGTPGNPNFQLWQEFLNPDENGGSWHMVQGTINNALLGAITTFAAGEGGEGTAEASLDLMSGTGGFPDNHLVWVPNYLTNMFANDAVVADFNGDGRPDIAVVYSGNPGVFVYGRLRVFLNNGTGFDLACDVEVHDPVQHNPLDMYSIAAADFRGNDTMDIVVSGNFDAYHSEGMVTVLANVLGNGTNFFPVRNWMVDSRIERVVAADFDGDAKPDVVYQCEDANTIFVRRNTSPSGDLTFADPISISLQNGYKSMQVSDIDGDGKPDLFWACEGASGFKAVRNTSSPGSLSFASPVHYLTGLTFQQGIAVGDLDGDGKPDVVSIGSPDQLSIIKNAIPPYSLSQSLVSVTTPTTAKNGTTTVSLQIKDAGGNTLATTGLTVAFSLTGSGTSSGTFGSTTDAGNGLYTATFTGTNVGTAKNVTASIGGPSVSSTLPTVTVAGGPNAVAQSTVTISRPIVASGATAIVTFQAKDANGDTLTTGGLSGVTFFLTGAGTSSGTFSSVTDSGNGKYYAKFTATTAGTAKSIGARISTDSVKTSLPTVTVNAGTFSISTSVITIASNSILKYDTTTVTLQVKDGSSNNVTTGGLDVEIQIFGSVNPVNNGKAFLTDVVDNQNGTYSSKLIGLTTSTGTAIAAYIYNSGTSSYQQVNSFPSPVTVNDRPVSLSLSTVGVGNATLVLGGDTYFYLYARNDKGEAYTATNLALNFSVVGGGTSTLTPNTTYQNMGAGVYQMSWHATGVGTARSVTTTIDGNAITSTLPTITVVPAGPGVDYPPYSQEAVPLDTTFSWEASTGATTYRAQIVADSLAGAVIIDTTGVTATSLHVTGLQNFRTYYFRLTAMNSGIESGIWNERSFQTVIAAPLPVFPPDRQQTVSLPVAFGWTAANGASTYRLQMAADTGFTSLVFDQDTLTQTTDTLQGLTAGVKYFWRLNATGNGGTSSFSATRSFTSSSVNANQQHYYVTTSGSDASAGTSWGTAFATLQHALSVASAGSQIWVAAGTYKPTTTSDRSLSFQLKSGVAVFGGFAGTETSLSERNVQTHVTILSGDIDGGGTLANNSYHVVVGNTFATAVLDGFTITGGKADGGQEGGGIYCSSGYPILSNLVITGNYSSDQGGGMYSILGSPTLRNVTFTANSSANRGGGFFAERGNPTFINCSFIHNSSLQGGAISGGDGTYPNTSSIKLTHTVFKNNSATNYGGAVDMQYGSAAFNNVLFYQDTANSGGAVSVTSGSSIFSNVTFNENGATGTYAPNGEGGGGIYLWLSSAVLKNVILWGNSGSPLFNGEVLSSMSSTVTLYHSLVQDSTNSTGGFGVLDLHGGVDVDSGGNVYKDPLFVSPGTADLRLSAGSPAIDAGIKTVVSSIADLNGNPRIVGSAVDKGAFEYQGAASSAADSVVANDSTYQFGSTNLGLDFSGLAPNRNVLTFASHYLTGPDSATFSGGTPSYVGSYRWVIAETGDSFSSATFTLSHVSTYSGLVNPAAVSIYHRETPGSGAFSPLTTTYDANTDELTATVSAFSEFIVAGDNTPLAVQLASFSATSDRLNAQLRWKTATETNNYGFEVDRTYRGPLNAPPDTAKSATAIVRWDSVGFVRGSGTSTSPKLYLFKDGNLSAGRYSYRLKLYDAGRGTSFSSTADVSVGLAPKVFSLSQNYPNPFNPTTKIEFTIPEDGRTTLRVYDILGREVETLLDQPLKAGEYHQQVFNASRLASGVYFGVLRFNNKQLVKKMLLLK